MELIKKNIHMNHLKCRRRSQITVEDDINVSDAKPDIDSLITEQADIVIDSVKAQNGKVGIKGKLIFWILYSNQEDTRHIHNLRGEIPFDETINIDEINEGDIINLNWDIDDVKVDLINSRKISVKSIVTFDALVELLHDIETTTEVIDDGIQNMKSNMEIAQIFINKKDIYRVKDEVDLPKNKSNIDKILWSTISMQGIETKLMEGRISVGGQLVVFVMYQPSDENAPLQWVENVLPFHGMIDMPGCEESMIPSITVKLSSTTIEPKADMDGELRVVDVDVVLDLDIKIYELSDVNVLSDVYSTKSMMEPVMENCRYEELLVKNFSKTKVADKVKVDLDKGHILQICSTSGNVKIDEMNIVDNGIEVEGIINVAIMYISSDDACPLKCVKTVMPFNYMVEAEGICPDSVFFLKQYLESVNAVMISTEEIEVKAVIGMDTLVFNKVDRAIITDVIKSELDMKKLEEMPGVVGYLVQKGDTLWNIAKENYTTIENIMAINDLQSDKVESGEKIIIVKQAGVVVN